MQKEAVCVPLRIFPKQPLEHTNGRPSGEQRESVSLRHGLEAVRIPWVRRQPQRLEGGSTAQRAVEI